VFVIRDFDEKIIDTSTAKKKHLSLKKRIKKNPTLALTLSKKENPLYLLYCEFEIMFEI